MAFMPVNPPDMDQYNGQMLNDFLNYRNSERVNNFNLQQNEKAKQDWHNRIMQAMQMNPASQPKPPQNVVLGPGALMNPIPEPGANNFLLSGAKPDTMVNAGIKNRVLDEKTANDESKINLSRDILSTKDANADADRAVKEKETNTKLGIMQQRADTYRFKAMHPDWKMVAQPGDTVKFVNPQNPSQNYDTGWDTGKMDEQDKIELLGTQQQENILKRGEIQQNLQTQRGNQADEQIDRRGNQTRETNAAKPDRGVLPTQGRVRTNMNAHELINKYPEYLPYVIFNSDNSVDIKRSTPPDVRDRINKTLYPEVKTAPTTTGKQGTTPVKPTTSSVPNVPEGRVPIWKDGKLVGHIPKSQADDATKQGYSLTAPTGGGGGDE